MKLRAGLSALPSSTGAVARLLMALAAAIAAFWILGAFVDALQLSIHRGEALRESQRNGAPAVEVARR